MKSQRVIIPLLSIILILSSVSCSFFGLLFGTEEEDKEIGEFDDVNIFDRSLLSEENDFITERSIVGDEEYLYAVTNGTEESPGKIVKVAKNGESHEIKTLYDEAIKKGYSDSHGYYLESIDYYKNKLVVEALPSLLQFTHGEIEIYCINAEDLSIEWRWIPEENGSLDYHAVGARNIAFWNDFCIVLYADEAKANGFYMSFIDFKGNQVIKRFIEGSRPKEEDDICIVGDKLLLHQKTEPLAIYDLNKLLTFDCDSNECIDFTFYGEANIYSGIVSDGENCYFCSWNTKNSDGCESVMIVYAVSLTDYQILWSYELDDSHYNGVNSILLNDGQLFLAADYGCVYSLNAANGNLIWKTKIADAENLKNLLIEGCIVKNYFVIPCGSDGYLYYFDIKSGKIKGKHYIPVFGGKRHCYVEDEYLYITTGSYIARLRLKEK